MEFHTFTRRELQTLCKKNKIPANITNAAMAEALKALKFVEGIEEVMQPSQSETAQSSIESLEGSEVTSPYVPPTAVRSTRRRNVLKEDLEDVTSVNTARRTTRKTAAKVSRESQVAAIETPALVSQTSRRKGQMESACRKMDSQLKECVEEEKMDISMTPAALGVTSRRRKVEATVQKVYSTRRSVRLAEKNMEMLNNEKTAEAELFNNVLLAEDDENQGVNLIDGTELLGITGDAITNVVEKNENKEKYEVVSAEQLDTTHEQESCMQFSAESQRGKVISDNIEFPGGEESATPVNVSDGVKDSETIWTSEIQTTVENSDVAGDSVEHVLLESKGIGHGCCLCLDNISGKEDDTELCDEVEQEYQDDKETNPEEVQNFNGTVAKLTELRLKQEDGIEEADSDFTNHLAILEQLKKSDSDEMETLGLEEREKAAENALASSDDAQVVPPPTKMTDDIEEADSDSIVHEMEIKKSEPDETMETLGFEESERAADEEQQAEQIPTSAIKQPFGVEVGVALAEQIPTSQAVQPNKYAATILSDNKENIGSGTKLVIMKQRIKSATDSGENLQDLSVRKLAKMLKEKLEITKKSSNEALPRAALQAVPENQGKN